MGQRGGRLPLRSWLLCSDVGESSWWVSFFIECSGCILSACEGEVFVRDLRTEVLVGGGVGNGRLFRILGVAF